MQIEKVFLHPIINRHLSHSPYHTIMTASLLQKIYNPITLCFSGIAPNWLCLKSIYGSKDWRVVHMPSPKIGKYLYFFLHEILIFHKFYPHSRTTKIFLSRFACHLILFTQPYFKYWNLPYIRPIRNRAWLVTPSLCMHFHNHAF